jgi:hypothetical protein
MSAKASVKRELLTDIQMATRASKVRIRRVASEKQSHHEIGNSLGYAWHRKKANVVGVERVVVREVGGEDQETGKGRLVVS